MTLREKEIKPLGSFPVWVIFRFLMPVGFVPPVLHYANWISGFLAVLLLFAGPNFTNFNYAHAYGHADEEGITFRRWFKKHQVSSDDVSRVDWSNSNLLLRPFVIVTLENRVGFFRKVKFFVKDETRKWGQPLREDWVPEIVLWMINHMKLNETFRTS